MEDLYKKLGGVDKLLHFAFGGLICALISIITIFQEPFINWYSSLYLIIGTIATFIIAIMKEIIDIKFEWKDVIATMLGCIPVYIAVILGIWFHQCNV